MLSKLKKERFLQGITQYRLEQETSIHQTLISLFERSIRKPNKEQRRKLAKALGAKEESLFPDI